MCPMEACEFPWLGTPLRELPFAILDLETTGFRPETERVTEVAIIRIEGGNEEVLDTLVNPGIPIPAVITRLTGIDDRLVRSKPRLSEVMTEIDRLLRGAILVTHNVPFDWAFLDWAYRAYADRPLRMPSLCTLHLARKFLNLESNKLGAVAAHFGIPPGQAHRALADTLAVKEILKRFLVKFETRGFHTGGDLFRQGLIHPFAPPART